MFYSGTKEWIHTGSFWRESFRFFIKIGFVLARKLLYLLFWHVN